MQPCMRVPAGKASRLPVWMGYAYHTYAGRSLLVFGINNLLENY